MTVSALPSQSVMPQPALQEDRDLLHHLASKAYPGNVLLVSSTDLLAAQIHYRVGPMNRIDNLPQARVMLAAMPTLSLPVYQAGKPAGEIKQGIAAIEHLRATFGKAVAYRKIGFDPAAAALTTADPASFLQDLAAAKAEYNGRAHHLELIKAKAKREGRKPDVSR